MPEIPPLAGGRLGPLAKACGNGAPLIADEAVVWTSLVGVSVSGSTVTKTGSAGWNAGAISAKTLRGDGYVEFTVQGPSGYRMCGLGVGNTDAGYADIDFGVTPYVSNPDYLKVWESGTNMYNSGLTANSDIIRVARVGTTIRYYLNGTLFYTSGATSTGDLVVDCSINTPGCEIGNARITGAWS